MALTGTLADVRLDELASLLQQQTRTGRLTLTFPEGRVAVVFRDGWICQVDDERRPANRRIGELLVAGGCVERSALATALEEQRTNPRPLGTLLIARGSLGTADLHRYLDLQFRESLYPLFEETGGAFEFDGSAQAPRTCAPPPVGVDDLLMEAARRIDELPEVTRTVPSTAARVRRSRETLVLPAGSPLADRLGERESQVFLALEGRPSVSDLVGRTGLSTFDVMKAVALLLQADVVDLADSPRTAPGGEPASRRLGIWERRPGVTRPLLHVVLGLLVATTVLALVINLYMDRVWVPTASAAFPVEVVDSPYRSMRTEAHLGRLRTVIEVFRLDEGGYPSSLAGLVEGGRLEEQDLRFPGFRDPYYYRPTAEGFVLLPPKR